MRDLTYWECPAGDARVVVKGVWAEALVPFACIPALGAAMTDEDVFMAVPAARLSEMETAVEHHESTHAARPETGD